MNKSLTLIFIALAACFTSQSTAQCVGCTGGVTPSFSQPTYNSAPIYDSAQIHSSAPIYNSVPIYSQAPVYDYSPAYSSPVASYSQPICTQSVFARQ